MNPQGAVLSHKPKKYRAEQVRYAIKHIVVLCYSVAGDNQTPDLAHKQGRCACGKTSLTSKWFLEGARLCLLRWGTPWLGARLPLHILILK